MARIFKYAFFTSTVAYFLAAVLLFVYFLADAGWNRINSDTGEMMVSALTLALSEFSWWGGFFGLAVLVPWLGSALVLALLLHLFAGRTRRWYLFGGVSLAVYYLAMFFVCAAGLITAEKIVCFAFLIWVGGGFILGCVVAFIVDKIMKPQFAV